MMSYMVKSFKDSEVTMHPLFVDCVTNVMSFSAVTFLLDFYIFNYLLYTDVMIL